MVSIGLIKSSLAVLVKISEPNIKTQHTIKVVKIENNAYIRVKYLKS